MSKIDQRLAESRVFENTQSSNCLICFFVGPLHGVSDCIGFLNNLVHIHEGISIAFFDRLLKDQPLRFASFRQGIDERQSRLSIGQIIPKIFPSSSGFEL